MKKVRGLWMLLVLVGSLAVLGYGGPCRAESATGESAAIDHDPLERVNRKIFWFNDKIDVYILEPVATGWDWIAPDRVQHSVRNFFVNLRFPIVTVNDLLQGKVQHGAVDVARFAVNTTLGVAGFFDPASDLGLTENVEDFGQTLGWWGVPLGPYLVLPLLGPSSPRDAGGLVADYATSVVPFFVSSWILLGTTTANVVNTRSLLLTEVKDAKAAAIDYYALVRNAYIQRRQALVDDSPEVAGEMQENLYELPEETAP